MKAALALLLGLAKHASGTFIGGGQHGLRFTGKLEESGSQSLVTRMFDEAEFADGITISFFYKQNVPLSEPSDGLEMHIGNAGNYFSVIDPEGTEDEMLIMKCTDFNLGVCLFGNGFAYNGDVFRAPQYDFGDTAQAIWVHHTLSYDAHNQTVLLLSNYFVNGTFDNVVQREFFRENMSLPVLESKRVYINLGGAYGSDIDLTGTVDEFCVLKHSISAGEALNISRYGCEQLFMDDGGVSLLWKFDDLDDVMFDSAVNHSSGIKEAYLNSSYGEQYFTCHGKGDGPHSVLSAGLPLFVADMGSIILPLENINNQGITRIPLDCDDGCGIITVDQAPQFGTLNFTADFKELLYIQDIGHAGESDTFRISANSRSARVELVNVGYPQISMDEDHMQLNEGGVTILFLPRFSHHIVDMDDPDKLQLEILDIDGLAVVDGSIQLFECVACLDKFYKDEEEYYYYDERQEIISEENEITKQLLPLTVGDSMRRLIVKHNSSSMMAGECVLRIKYRVIRPFDNDSYSNNATLCVDVPTKNKVPHALPGNVLLQEDQVGPAQLEFQSSDHEDNDVYIEILNFPNYGKLFLDADGQVPLQQRSSDAMLSQWVTDSPLNKASSCWDETYCVGAVVGEPTIYPGTNDLPSWQPEDGQQQDTWVVVDFEEPVYARELIVIETWSPGAVVKIEGLKVDANGMDRWITLWEGAPVVGSHCPENKSPYDRCAMMSHFQLCPKPFRLRTFKVYMHLPDAQYWPALDAIMLNGYAHVGSIIPAMGTDLFNNKLFYRPDLDFFGLDTVEFQVMDCPYYSRNQMLRGPDTRRAQVQIAVENVQDPPKISDFNLDVPSSSDWLNSTLMVIPTEPVRFNLSFFDGDGLGTIKMVKIDATTLGGILRLGFGKEGNLSHEHVNDVTSKIISNSLDEHVRNSKVDFMFFPLKCVHPKMTTTSFRVTVQDTTNMTMEKEFFITVDCETQNYPSETVVAVSYVLFVGLLLIILVVIIGLQVFRKHQLLKIAQIEFLYMICFGSLVSALTILTLIVDDRVGYEGFEGLRDGISVFDAADGEHVHYLNYASGHGGNPLADRYCAWSVYLFSIGFVMIYMPLFLKLYRLMTVLDLSYHFSKNKQLAMQTKRLVMRMLLFVMVDVIICVSWDILDPMQYRRFDIGKVGTGGYCTSNHAPIFVGVLAGYHFAILGWGTWICTQLSGVNSYVSEARLVKFALIASLEVLFIAIPISLIDGGPDMTLFIRVGLVFTGNFAVLVALFGPRFIWLMNPASSDAHTGDLLREAATVRAVTKSKNNNSGGAYSATQYGYTTKATSIAPDTSTPNISGDESTILAVSDKS